jgi:hypothetical protein
LGQIILHQLFSAVFQRWFLSICFFFVSSIKKRGNHLVPLSTMRRCSFLEPSSCRFPSSPLSGFFVWACYLPNRWLEMAQHAHERNFLWPHIWCDQKNLRCPRKRLIQVLRYSVPLQNVSKTQRILPILYCTCITVTKITSSNPQIRSRVNW